MIDLKADQDEIKEVLGNEYQDYNLERYQQTDIHRIANVDSKVIISTRRYRKCREALYFKEFEIQCFCVSIGDSRSMRKIVI